jgi:hypothetical protein
VRKNKIPAEAKGVIIINLLTAMFLESIKKEHTGQAFNKLIVFYLNMFQISSMVDNREMISK